jgi:hypothetical protein
MPEQDPLRPYSSLAQQAPDSEIPISSTANQEPRPPVRLPQATAHNYYPTMRPAQHPNANTARSTARGFVPRCTLGRGQFLTGAARHR